MEKIDINEFIEEVKKVDEEFAEECISETHIDAVSQFLLDTTFSKGDFYKWSRNESFPYELYDIYEEKGNYKDETTTTGIFQRKSDHKFFKLWMHDSGLIGPISLTMCDYLEEVKPIIKTKINWK